jgi:molecular chaperone DnaK
MRLGIDFGTTRMVVAASDRGNYPVLSFECPDGSSREWVPSLVAVRGEERLYGWEAWAAYGEPGVTLVRSIKRVLGESGPETMVQLGPQQAPMGRILGEMLGALKRQILEGSSLDLKPGERLEALLGVPANANSNQRFLTVEGFGAAGFEVLGLLNEPSAASIEYAHRLAGTDTEPEKILVYDLGGGTFDVSLVEREDHNHTVAATESIPTLGGDDFDDLLADLALEAAGLGGERKGLSAAEEFALIEECRARKEALHPNTRRVVVDLDAVREGWGQATVVAADFYEACRPLVEETLHAAEDLLARTGAGDRVSLYVTGGGSELPLVSRLLKERFGRHVRRSAYTRAATAIGLAIQAGETAPYQLRERFTRHFGVWREGEGGRRMVFDPLFEKGTPLPGAKERALERVRVYAPAHNVGHFRYLECTHRAADGEPTGDITAWDEIRFPFDPALAGIDDLLHVTVRRSEGPGGQSIEERYTADASGAVVVRISNVTSGYSRNYRLGRWAATPKSVEPKRTPRKRKKETS